MLPISCSNADMELFLNIYFWKVEGCPFLATTTTANILFKCLFGIISQVYIWKVKMCPLVIPKTCSNADLELFLKIWQLLILQTSCLKSSLTIFCTLFVDCFTNFLFKYWYGTISEHIFLRNRGVSFPGNDCYCQHLVRMLISCMRSIIFYGLLHSICRPFEIRDFLKWFLGRLYITRKAVQGLSPQIVIK